jgi:diguanylate cyclase
VDAESLMQDDVEVASRVAEAVMKRLGEERVAPTPENFTLWYTHFSGRAPDLSRAIDILSSNRQSFDAARSSELYERYVGSGREAGSIRAAGVAIQALIDQLASILGAHDTGTTRYGEVLEAVRDRLDPALGPDHLTAILGLIAGETRKMMDHNRILQSQLSTSGEQLAEMRRNLDDVRREAVTDGLTGLRNRKHFDGEVRRAAADAMEIGEPLSLMMVDIDHFKRFNDTWGHATGDTVLALVARTLGDCVGEREIACRYGGEEFAIIAPGLTLDRAAALGERIRAAVSSRQVFNRSRNLSLGQVTLSVGISEFDPGEPLASWIQRADDALYAAKREGRNRVVSIILPASA